MKTLSPHDTCCCGSGKTHESCCLMIFENHALAKQAEQLMRARYTGFVLQNESFVLKSWHPRTRPKTLNFDDNPVTWVGLEIHGCEKGGEEDDSGSVVFTTSYIEAGKFCKLREESQFLKEQGHWFYLNGKAQIDKTKIERNSLCPCGSGKKFKKCCLLL